MKDAFASKRIEETIEVVCGRGCEYVRQVIIDLEAEKFAGVAELHELKEMADCKAVLLELKAIMSVYDESDGSCCPVPNFSSRPSQARMKT